MPYTAVWDLQSGVMIVGGTVRPDELPGFLRALEHAAGTGTDAVANWYDTLMEMARVGTMKVHAIKFWRMVSGQGLAESKAMIESIEAGGGPPPNAYPNVSATDLTWAVTELRNRRAEG